MISPINHMFNQTNIADENNIKSEILSILFQSIEAFLCKREIITFDMVRKKNWLFTTFN